MQSSGMLGHLALVRTEVSEEPVAFIIRIKLGKPGTMFAVTSNQSMLDTANVVPSSPIYSSETSVITRTTWPDNSQDGILQTG
jgi:hypothetical protein